MERITLEIGGMSCGHCVGQVQKALETVPVATSTVKVGSAVVEFDGTATSEEAISTAIRGAGYDVRAVQR